MDKNQIFFTWVLPIITILLFIGSINSYIVSRLDLKDLIKVEGKLNSYEYYTSHSRNSTSKTLRLFMDDGNIYKVTDKWERKFESIESALKKSRLVELYHNSHSQTIWRFGISNNVYQLKIGSILIIGIKENQIKSKKVSTICGALGIIGLIVILIRKKTKN